MSFPPKDKEEAIDHAPSTAKSAFFFKLTSEDRKFTLTLAYNVDRRNSKRQVPKLGIFLNDEAF